jgi:hypothetical protein
LIVSIFGSPDLHDRAGRERFQANVQIAEVQVATVCPTALLEVQRAGPERARTGGGGRQSAELDVLHRSQDVDARPAPLHAYL